jgi:hypothetical protein
VLERETVPIDWRLRLRPLRGRYLDRHGELRRGAMAGVGHVAWPWRVCAVRPGTLTRE